MNKNYVDNCYAEVVASLEKAKLHASENAVKHIEETLAKAKEMYENYEREIGVNV